MFEKVLYQMRKSRGESVIKRKIERVVYFRYNERERERQTERDRDRERDMCLCLRWRKRIL